MSYYSWAHGGQRLFSMGAAPSRYCILFRALSPLLLGANPQTHANELVPTHGPGTRTASHEWEHHTCKHGHTRVHKKLKHQNYELRNTSLIIILIGGDWRMGKNVSFMIFSMRKEVGPTGI